MLFSSLSIGWSHWSWSEGGEEATIVHEELDAWPTFLFLFLLTILLPLIIISVSPLSLRALNKSLRSFWDSHLDLAQDSQRPSSRWFVILIVQILIIFVVLLPSQVFYKHKSRLAFNFLANMCYSERMNLQIQNTT